MAVDYCKKIAALIPTFNEEKNIEAVIRDLKRYIQDIIVIDDGSRDQTAKIAKEAGAKVIYHKKNLGKGAALMSGFKYFLSNFPDSDALIILDGDGQHSSKEVDNFIRIFTETGADLILGARAINKEKMPILRRVGNFLISKLISKKISQKIKDSQSGFRLLSKKFLNKLDIKNQGYGVETEILIEAARKNFVIRELPIETIYLNKKQANLIKDTKIIFAIVKEILK